MDVVKLHGPSNFTPVIRNMVRQASKYNSEPTVYSILLIITDGIITDMEETKRTTNKASGFPLSIIIVGVGDEDFSQMEQLNVNKVVQFIEMKTGEEDGKVALAKEALKEVPRQVIYHPQLINHCSLWTSTDVFYCIVYPPGG